MTISARLLHLILVVFLMLPAINSVRASNQDLDQIEADLRSVQAEIAGAEAEQQQYAGGLIYAMISQRLETLRLTEAMLDQRRLALREGAEFDILMPSTKSNSSREAEILADLVAAKEELAVAEAEADRYTGGLVQALALTTVMTHRQTVAMLTQAALAARYGLAVPEVESDAIKPNSADGKLESTTSNPATTDLKMESASECLRVVDFGSSLLDRNDTFARVAWKTDIENSCKRDFVVLVEFALTDEEDYEVETDRQEISVPANSVGKARGDMLVHPTRNYDRVKYNTVHFSSSQ